MTACKAADQCVARMAPLVVVRFDQPHEFVAELRARGPTVEPLVRLTLVGLTRRGYRGSPLPGQDLWVHAGYLRRTGDLVQLVTLERFVGAWRDAAELDARTEQRANQVLQFIRASAAALGVELVAGRYEAAHQKSW